MSKTISISDTVYEMLKKEKDGKSFSEVIAEKIESGSKLEEVAGAKTLEQNTLEEVKEDIRKGSEATEKRVEDEVA